MLKPLILGTSIAVLSTLFLPATATDWRTVGVTTRTRETVAIDMNSINRVSRYDVRFRYLIGKDLVQASVNCDSSLVTPNIGKSFVPDLTGATREMIKLACGVSRNNSTTANFGSGYGHGTRTANTTNDDNRSSYVNGRDARGYWVPDVAVRIVKDDLRNQGNMYHLLPVSKLADGMGMYCESRSQGHSRSHYMEGVYQFLSSRSVQDAPKFVDFQVSVIAASEVLVCPQFKD